MHARSSAPQNPYTLATSDGSRDAAPGLSRAIDLNALLAGNGTMGPGQYGPSVLFLQQLLLALAFRAPETGIYEQQTERAVAQFQATQSLPRTGTVDARTLRLLEAMGALPAAPASKKAATAPTIEDLRSAPAGTRKAAELTQAALYRQSAPNAAAEAPLPSAEAPVAPALALEAPRAAAVPATTEAELAVYREKKEKIADLGLRIGEQEVKAAQDDLNSRGFIARMFLPEETKKRKEALETRYLPELRAKKSEYETAKRLGAPQAELDQKLDRYFSASTETREFVKGSLSTERAQFEKADENLGTTIKVARGVRDVSLGTAAALASGGTSLAVTGAVVAGGAVVKTASDEAAHRVEGHASSAGEIATSMVKNTAGLAVDAAGGTAFKALGAAAQAGRIGVTGFAAGAGATGVVSGATKRGINGEEILDARAMVADGLTGAVTGGVAQKLAPAIQELGAGARVLANGTVGAASGAGAQVASNAINGRELHEGVLEATVAGAGTGVVMGASTQRSRGPETLEVVEAVPANARHVTPVERLALPEAPAPLALTEAPAPARATVATPGEPPPLPAQPPPLPAQPPPLPATAKTVVPATEPPPLPAAAKAPAPAPAQPPPLPRMPRTPELERFYQNEANVQFNDAAERILTRAGIQVGPTELGSGSAAEASIPKNLRRRAIEEGNAAVKQRLAELEKAPNPIEVVARETEVAHTQAALHELLDQHPSLSRLKGPDGQLRLEDLPTDLAHQVRTAASNNANTVRANYGQPLAEPLPPPADPRSSFERAAAAHDLEAQDQAFLRAYNLSQEKTPGQVAAGEKAGMAAVKRYQTKNPDPSATFDRAIDAESVRAFRAELARAAQTDRRLMPELKTASPMDVELLGRLSPEVRVRALSASNEAAQAFAAKFGLAEAPPLAAQPPPLPAQPPPLPAQPPPLPAEARGRASFSDAVRQLNRQLYGVDVSPSLDPAKWGENLSKMFQAMTGARVNNTRA